MSIKNHWFQTYSLIAFIFSKLPDAWTHHNNNLCCSFVAKETLEPEIFTIQKKRSLSYNTRSNDPPKFVHLQHSRLSNIWYFWFTYMVAPSLNTTECRSWVHLVMTRAPLLNGLANWNWRSQWAVLPGNSRETLVLEFQEVDINSKWELLISLEL